MRSHRTKPGLPAPDRCRYRSRARIERLRALVASAKRRAKKLVLVSSMVELSCQRWAERFLIPAFVFFFQMLYPFAWVADRNRTVAAAAGGCMLARQRGPWMNLAAWPRSGPRSSTTAPSLDT